MVYHRLRGVTWLVSTLLTVCLALPATTQQASKSDVDLIQEGPLALAAAHNEKPRYGGKFLSAGNEKIPHYDISRFTNSRSLPSR